MSAYEKEALWMQARAFHLLEEIVSEPFYYAGVDLLERKRVRNLLMIANAHHAIIIQSIQLGNIKRALKYLLVMRKISAEIKSSRCLVEEIIEKRFSAFHELNEEEV